MLKKKVIIKRNTSALKHSLKQLRGLTAEVVRRLLEIFVSYTILVIDDEHYVSSVDVYVAGNSSYFYKNCVGVNSGAGNL